MCYFHQALKTQRRMVIVVFVVFSCQTFVRFGVVPPPMLKKKKTVVRRRFPVPQDIPDRQTYVQGRRTRDSRQDRPPHVGEEYRRLAHTSIVLCTSSIHSCAGLWCKPFFENDQNNSFSGIIPSDSRAVIHPRIERKPSASNRGVLTF